MKKPFIYLLTAGLAVSMIANTGLVNAEEKLMNKSEATVDFKPGFLKLTEVSSITFNEVDIVAEDATAKSTSDVSATVSDLRGTHAGWTLTAGLKEFKDETGSPSLAATNIKFVSGSAVSSANSNPVVLEEVKLEAGEEAKSLLVKAQEGAGMGETTVNWDSENVLLTVPESVVKVGQHTAAIEWLMTDSPQDTEVTE
ncbi:MULTISPECIES: WxL domain-containing protein [Jeotgalicoccus]|uniref:WxL domain-containing protein n=1 Tax=Jeotgalicoccus TaxID=227979 RepID=UPI0030FDCC3B